MGNTAYLEPDHGVNHLIHQRERQNIMEDFQNMNLVALVKWDQADQVDGLNNGLEWGRAINNLMAADGSTTIRAFARKAAEAYNAANPSAPKLSPTYYNSRFQRAIKMTACLQDPKCAAKLDKYVRAAREAGDELTLGGLYMHLFPAKAGKAVKVTLVASIAKVESVDELDAIIKAAQARKAELVKAARKAA